MKVRAVRNSGLRAIAWTVVLSSLAQLSMKAGMLELRALGELDGFNWHNDLDGIFMVLALVTAGLTSYAVSMAVWMVALTRHELSFAYPLLSISYVLVYAAAVSMPFFGEVLLWERVLGVGLIVSGVLLVTATGTPEAKSKQGSGS